MKSAIVFTGQIRDEEKFLKSINDAISLRKSGLVDEIVFSVWNDEINQYDNIKNLLIKNKIKLVENPIPKNPGTDSTFFQIKNLEYGLEAIKDKKCFVLKNRSDVYIKYDFLKKLFENKENLLKITHNLVNGNIFKYKIWIPSCEIKIPFYIADICFFGYFSDMKKLAYYKEYDQTINKIAHIKRFVDPFLEKYPKTFDPRSILYGVEYLKFIKLKVSKIPSFFRKPLKLFLWKYNEFQLKIFTKRDLYIKALTAYYSILYSHFYIDTSSFKDQIEFRGGEYNIDKNLIHTENLQENFKKKFKTKNIEQSFCYDQSLFDNIFSKKNTDILSKRILFLSKNWIDYENL